METIKIVIPVFYTFFEKKMSNIDPGLYLHIALHMLLLQNNRPTLSRLRSPRITETPQ